MSFDKIKVMRSAERNLAQGKIQPAIKDYCQIVENDPRDYNTLNILGDLYVRVEAKDQATKCFNRLAEHYSNLGFIQKAIAMYNKIVRINPDSIEIYAKLAPLYQMQGLMAEARSHYQAVAQHYEKNGEKLKSLKIWGQIADLDPNNTDTRLKLAEGLLSENQRGEAADAFIEAGSRLFAKGKTEESLTAFEKALKIRPADFTALNGIIAAKLALGLPDEAANYLERALEDQPFNTELLSLLATCYVEMENPFEAERITSRLVEREPQSYMRYIDIVRIYLRMSDLPSSMRVLYICAEQMMIGGQGSELEQWIEEVLAKNPEQIDALKLLVRLHSWMRNEPMLITALDRLAEAARLNGIVEEEKEALRQLSAIAQEKEPYIARLRELGEGENDFSYMPGSEADENIPSFENYENLTDEQLEEKINYGTTNEQDSFGYITGGFSKGTGPLDKTDFGYTTISETESKDFAFVNLNSESYAENGGYQSEFDAETPTNFSETTTALFENNNVETTEEQNQPELAETETSEAELSETATSHLLSELESVDFYIEQGYFDLALETLNLLQVQFGETPEIIQRRSQLDSVTTTSSDDRLFDSSSNLKVEEESTEPEFAQNNEYQSDSIESTGLENETNEPDQAEQYETAFEQIENEINNAENQEFQEAHHEFGAVETEEYVAQYRVSGSLTTPPEDSAVNFDEPESNEEMTADSELSEISNSAEVVESEEIKNYFNPLDEIRGELGFEEDDEEKIEGDYETHYNLGIAYKEMGLMDEAAEEFQSAVRLVKIGDGTPRYLQCCNLLGHCFMEKQMPKLAVKWFQKGLQSQGHTEEEYQALRYELGTAYAMDGDKEKALELFAEIYSINVTYRNVGEKLRELQGFS
jgi:tetratricopeptide (TPR) repeat protein